MNVKIRKVKDFYDVKISRLINVNGVKMELVDLYKTLLEMKNMSKIYITDKEMIRVLKALKVISYGGVSYSPAVQDDNFNQFFTIISDMYWVLMDEQKKLTEKYNENSGIA